MVLINLIVVLDIDIHNSHPTGYIKQQYLPDNLVGRKFYTPKTNNKNEQNLAQYKKFIDNVK